MNKYEQRAARQRGPRVADLYDVVERSGSVGGCCLADFGS